MSFGLLTALKKGEKMVIQVPPTIIFKLVRESYPRKKNAVTTVTAFFLSHVFEDDLKKFVPCQFVPHLKPSTFFVGAEYFNSF